MSDDTQTTTTEEAAAITSRDQIPDRDNLVELRRNKGLTNDEIADDHCTDFSAREIGMFCSVYGIEKGWKDEAYLRSQIEGGVRPEELADRWPVTEDTVAQWMDRFDIEEDPAVDAYGNAMDALDVLAETVTDDELADRYEQLSVELDDDAEDYFEA